ncbi:energy-coupling factor transporter transmembrane protein EcfT [Gordonia sp. (in: high G+C Gram-positive bacteria)]|uniref:energy-coupling factor transporter transmembrane component T family protein n=1 Tax=Gordonia sp. (in: high G+C Gram-positive bacteria) TaxID=84139 RepID=UPI0016A9A4E2|nr:energy-coupling factor transporter transmembrane protein EcfT [Gordonia sp. (in: high G+C Gram-positive bacteria)]NLG45959.1 energy-coupling factor transporter transmembrane protein EcfT [Gordonia sp. (in: high G+C Gram-positive bacteria)]
MIGLYVPGDSLLHRLPAGLKFLALTASIITIALVVRTPMSAAIALATSAALFVVARVHPRHAWSQIRGVLWMLAILFVFQWIITDAARAFVVCAILLASVALAAVVTLTTRTADMLDAIVSALRPLERFGVRTDLIAMTFALAIRSIPLIAEVLAQVDQARRARGLRAGPRVLLAPTVLAALRTADGFAETLAARGMD